ncbi:hypothetical protein KC946_03485 [Candidatus Saccharibacteria bacterium]|nr:hypothetical protein [Candidatus Saccharibacteria bacterium]
MKRGLFPKGFTIVETMIFLAVSSAILISALTLVGGSQNKAEFTTALNDANEQITAVINNVANGYYPSSNKQCKDNPSSDKLEILGNSSEIGTESNCVYLGKVVEFSSGESFKVYNIAGLRVDTSGAVITDIANVKATAIDNPEIFTLKNGLTVESIQNGSSAQKYGSIGFFTSLGKTDDEDQLISGSLSTDFLALEPGGVNNSDDVPGLFPTATNSGYYNNNKNKPDGIRICLKSGTSNEFGILQIGGQGRTATTSLTVQGNCT